MHSRPPVGLNLDNLLRWADEERGRIAAEIDDDERRWRRSPETRPLAETRLDVRTINAFEAAGIWTLGDLAALSAKDIENMPNFGPTTLQRVREVLREFGLELAN